MGISYLDGERLRRAIIAGAERVISCAPELDRINVFPVADSDTGRNLATTMGAVVGCLRGLRATRVCDVASSAAEAALHGARGNSGVIMAQLFSGFAEALAGETRVGTPPFARAVGWAVDRAWEALVEPVEGTVLSVLSGFARCVKSKARQLEDFVPLLVAGLEAAREALRRTPESLPVLREAGVVDAGGLGFVRFLEGIVHLIRTGEAGEAQVFPAASSPAAAEARPGPARFRYCVECVVEGADRSPEEVGGALRELGDSVAVAGSRGLLHLHVHTNLPAYVFEAAGAFGRVRRRKADDMWRDMAPGRREGVALVTDSSCDLPVGLLTRHLVALVPVRVRVGEEDLRDRVDITPEGFCRRLQEGTPMGTSQPPPADFRDTFRALGLFHRGILAIFLAGGLSGTYGTGLKAAEALRREGLRIEVVDSGTLSGGLGLLVLCGARALEAGLPLEAAAELVREARERLRAWATLPDLTPLARSGRIPWAAGWLARRSRLGMVVGLTGGKISPVAPGFGKARLERKLLRLALEAMGEMEAPEAVVAHAGSSHPAAELRRRLSAAGAAEVHVTPASPALTVHAGLGSLGIALLDMGWVEKRIDALKKARSQD